MSSLALLWCAVLTIWQDALDRLRGPGPPNAADMVVIDRYGDVRGPTPPLHGLPHRRGRGPRHQRRM
jgi:hypothetical protein